MCDLHRPSHDMATERYWEDLEGGTRGTPRRSTHAQSPVAVTSESPRTRLYRGVVSFHLSLRKIVTPCQGSPERKSTNGMNS